MLLALHQLNSCLNIRGLLPANRNNKTAFVAWFINSDRKLVVEELLGIIVTNFSQNGINKFEKEVDIYRYFTEILEH